MKKSIIYLGIALVAFANVASALDFQQSFVKEDQTSPQTEQSIESSDVNTNGNDSIEKKNAEEDVNPGIGVASCEKSMEEIIAENTLITEGAASSEISALCPEKSTDEIIAEIIASAISTSTEATPVCNEKSVEQIIFEDSQITESAVVKEIQPCHSAKTKKA